MLCAGKQFENPQAQRYSVEEGGLAVIFSLKSSSDCKVARLFRMRDSLAVFLPPFSNCVASLGTQNGKPINTGKTVKLHSKLFL